MATRQHSARQSELVTLQEERSTDGGKRLRWAKMDIKAGRLTPHDEIFQRLATKKK